MTTKRRIAITDEHGEHVASVYVPDGTIDFESATLEGFVIPGLTTLRGRSFRNAMMYWAMMAGADLSSCNFEGAELRGANLTDASLINANLTAANLGLDNLGGATSLRGANLTNAILDRTNLSGAVFDKRTVFPVGFDPNAAGMILKGEI
jgi:uncharacterized protein YjbI with pentapeptide repeats